VHLLWTDVVARRCAIFVVTLQSSKKQRDKIVLPYGVLPLVFSTAIRSHGKRETSGKIMIARFHPFSIVSTGKVLNDLVVRFYIATVEEDNGGAKEENERFRLRDTVI